MAVVYLNELSLQRLEQFITNFSSIILHNSFNKTLVMTYESLV